MKFWRVWAVIRTAEIVINSHLVPKMEYDTFIEDHLVVGTSRKKALEEAEMHFYKKYGIGVDVILVGTTSIKM